MVAINLCRLFETTALIGFKNEKTELYNVNNSVFLIGVGTIGLEPMTSAM